ncbi:MAG: hypothetical protein HKO96_09180 [Flavobacteriaceae bacterium]|nr:hypothetical protein [Flavobacteriaceae bacterium]
MAGKKFLSTDKIVALTAMFIGVLTLIIFIRQTNIMDTQGRLSVMPYLLLETSNNGENRTFSIDFVNHGVGPAIVVSRKIYYQGKTYDMEFHDFLKSQIKEMDSIHIMNHTTVQPGFALISGGSRNILRAGGDNYSYFAFLKVMQELDKNDFEYELIYNSIYDDKWVVKASTNEPEQIHQPTN